MDLSSISLMMMRRLLQRINLCYNIHHITSQLRAVSAALALAAEPLVSEEPPPPDGRRQDGVHVRDGDALPPLDVRARPHLLQEPVAAPLRPAVDAAERVGDAVVRAHGHERVAESDLRPRLFDAPISQARQPIPISKLRFTSGSKGIQVQYYYSYIIVGAFPWSKTMFGGKVCTLKSFVANIPNILRT